MCAAVIGSAGPQRAQSKAPPFVRGFFCFWANAADVERADVICTAVTAPRPGRYFAPFLTALPRRIRRAPFFGTRQRCERVRFELDRSEAARPGRRRIRLPVPFAPAAFFSSVSPASVGAWRNAFTGRSTRMDRLVVDRGMIRNCPHRPRGVPCIPEPRRRGSDATLADAPRSDYGTP
ncbi:hypothetical protein DB354_18135 [Opitutus sp. ER46]|nr:hypothetical protein DB354_18135 [Opitutus sp. ER46]